jgi:hypothetical protein
MTTTTSIGHEDLDSSADVLRVAREARAAAMRADAVLLTAAVTWAEQHPPESIDEAATWITPGGDTGLTLAGECAPLVAEFCIAEFALAIGRSTDGGRALLAAAVELKYRLPRVWARMQTGELEAWRARRIAEATLNLTQEAAAFVDAQVAPFAHRIGMAALERLVDEAIVRFMPEKAAEDAEKAAEGRHFTIDHQQVSFGGTSQITGELDLADALDLDTAIAKAAHELLTLGSTDSLDVRRSIAAGQLARNQLALDLTTDTDVPAESHPSGRRPKPRQVVLHVHLTDTAITGTAAGSVELARVENQHRILTADQIRTWCATPEHRSNREAGDRPQRTHPRRGLRSPHPPAGTSRAARPQLRVPLVHPISPEDRRRPCHPLRPGRHHLE